MILKLDLNPAWNDRHVFDYNPDDILNFHNKHLTIELWKRGVGGKKSHVGKKHLTSIKFLKPENPRIKFLTIYLGYIKVDLFTLASGPVAQNLHLMKKVKR